MSLDQEKKVGIIGHYDDDDDDDINSVSSDVSLDDEANDVFVESNSSSSNESHALGDMSGLLQRLPSKRGLSKHFQGKSQSFTCLSKVMCLKDLAKPENPYNKKLKSCKSYIGLSRVLSPPTRSSSSSKLLTQETSSGASCSSLSNSSRLATCSSIS